MKKAITVILSEAKNLIKSINYETLHGACPERDSSVASLLQTCPERKVKILHFVQNDKRRDDRRRRVQGDNLRTFARASNVFYFI